MLARSPPIKDLPCSGPLEEDLGSALDRPSRPVAGSVRLRRIFSPRLSADFTPAKSHRHETRTVLIDRHPGRTTQSIGLARAIGTDPDLIHEPSVGVVGTKGDSQCYLGVMAKVEAIHAELKGRIGKGQGQLKLRLVQPEYTIATSDGIRNGTREMRYSLIGREVTNDALCEHLSATGLAGTIAVVACDKPPVGTLAALLEHNRPPIIMSDGPIHPGTDPKTGETIDLVTAYQVAGHPDAEYRHHIACHACPGIGSCGGMFTYNTMQTFIGVRRHAAAAHGGAAVRRSAPGERVRRASWSTISRT